MFGDLSPTPLILVVQFHVWSKCSAQELQKRCSLWFGNVGKAAPTYTESPERVQNPAPLKMEDGGQEGDAGTSLLFSHTYPSLSSSGTPDVPHCSVPSLTHPLQLRFSGDLRATLSFILAAMAAPLSCISWDWSPSSLSEGQRAPPRLGFPSRLFLPSFLKTNLSAV